VNSNFNRNLFIDRPPRPRLSGRLFPMFVALAILASISLFLVGSLMNIYNQTDKDVYEVFFATSASNHVELRIAGVTLTDHYNCQVLVASNLEGNLLPPAINIDQIPTCIPGELYEKIRMQFLGLVSSLSLLLLLTIIAGWYVGSRDVSTED